ncbi:hypothetical protein [Mangrovihabitans endophyticus]|uniref:Uncharacterized protein n=1 Tax=Mangrovihabitans endophyticus TaxID=1751298 RepID=A0A8J3FPY5_9ACTN|nr:hypothetical protein [Mangrovihabitans endophyticus]GGL02944.1 hypothetical protein GCM10012284_41940 [Mangrovihabitans endophyticus]
MSTLVPPLFAGFVDDAAVLAPGFASAPDALARHREHVTAWYGPLLGVFLLPTSETERDVPLGDVMVGLVNDGPIAGLPAVIARLRAAGVGLGRVEAAVARRGEDPQPGLDELGKLASTTAGLDVYAEIPLSWGLLAALDRVAQARAEGLSIGPKFRVGGLAAELFPTPVELAAVICACRDRELPFRLATGLRHAMRHTDPETGFTHHGFLNVLVATLLATDGAEVAEVAEVLAATHPVPLVEPARSRRDQARPLWCGFGTTNLLEPLTDLIRLGLVDGGYS